MITGYNDDFNRTVVAGFGVATSGQTYTLNSTASQFNVAPSTATILPTAVGERAAFVDRQTSDVDITLQVALSGIPATNLMTVGAIFKRIDPSNYYTGTMSVAAGGAISLRFSKVVAGGLVTIISTAIGVTYVANTFYNLRIAAYWSNALQTNVMQIKLWATNATEPGGWMVTTTDNAFTQFTAGSLTGCYCRDEAAAPGAVTASFRNLAVRTYGLPVPAGADTMCADPGVAYPKQVTLESLADATDLVMAGFDPYASLAQFFPRVRVSVNNLAFATAANFIPTWTTTEFNVATGTNLGFDGQALYLPYGIWLATLEVQLNPQLADYLQINITGGAGPAEYAYTHMRSNPSQLNLDLQGGSGHVSTLIYSNNPAVPARVVTGINPNSATAYTARYAAFSAIKISDYF